MIIGVTGGIGAGKSTVLSILKEKYKAHLIAADEVGRSMMQPGEANYHNIVNAFGTEILQEDGKIDTSKLAHLAFSNPLDALRLNAVTHPNIRVRIEWMVKEILDADPDALIVIEAALLKEGHLSELCDQIWFVYADRSTRVRRIMETRGYSEQRCMDTIRRQKSDEAFACESDILIDNSGNLSETEVRIGTVMADMWKSKCSD